MHIKEQLVEQNSVDRLEDALEQAIAEAISKLGKNKLPLLPDRHTMHLMAKAAVAVYEAAVGNRE